MELSLKNYTTILAKELLKLAAKNTIRECDEVEKGYYVAYVDEGAETFDVSVTILKNGEVKDTLCDCANNQHFCRHKTALLMHIAGEKKVRKQVTVKAKISKSEPLLDDASLHELKDWIRNVLQKNPDLELAFIHHFTTKHQQFTPQDIVKITQDALKAVVKNKKNLDPTLLKKITDLWTELHAPVIAQYQADAINESQFLNLHTLLECCLRIHRSLNVNSKKIISYVDALLKKCVETVSDIYDETAWNMATGYFLNQIHDKNEIRFHYLQHLLNISSISTQQRRDALIEAIVIQYSEASTYNMAYGAAYTQLVFDIAVQYNMFEKYFAFFKPIEWSNSYNEKLIDSLIEIKQYALAEKYCLKQIAGNYKEEYNIPYLVFLKFIYAINKNENGLADVLKQLLPYTYNFDDYLYIFTRMQDEAEKKKWHTKILFRARNASRNYSNAAMEFCFRLADHEKKYTKMIEFIDGYTRYNLILAYFEPMVLTDKARLLKALLYKSDEYGWGLNNEAREKDAEVFPDLYEKMLKHYTSDYLRAAVKQTGNQYYYNRSGSFLNYMKEAMGINEAV
jgi:hypothetical protein